MTKQDSTTGVTKEHWERTACPQCGCDGTIEGRANAALRETLEKVRAECERPANRGIHTLNQMCAFLDGLHDSITQVLESKQ